MKENNTDKIAEIYKTLLEQEISNHTIFITVLLGIVVILLGATWWWNKSGATKEIKSEVEKQIYKEKKKIISDLKKEINESIDSKIKEYDTKIMEIESDVMRSMALLSANQELFSHSIYWWTKQLELNLKMENDKSIRNSVEWIKEDIEALEKKEKELKKEDENYKKVNVHQCEYVNEIIEQIPSLLEKEKKAIKKGLKNRIKNTDD